MLNLDLEAAKVGQAIIRTAKTENKKQVNELQAQLNKSLGILHESGIYALFLYLLAKSDPAESEHEDYCRVILNQLLNAVKNNKNRLRVEEDPHLDCNRQDYSNKILSWVQDNLVNALPRILLFRQFFQQVLTYARYAAEAREVEIKSKETSVESGVNGRVGDQP